MRTRLDALAARSDEIGEVRGLGTMLALELAERSPDRAREITVAAREQGLLLLSCGLYGNVIRLLPPVTASDEELERGLGIVEQILRA
jgi:4-aminobutyrate aminotransferase-like enzyme